jgi:hypothetical protein
MMVVMANTVTARRPRVAFVGGMDRLEPALVRAGAEVGVDVEVHYGNVQGRKGQELEGVVHRADHIVIVTGIVSHGGMLMAKKLGQQQGKPVRILRACGLAVARGILREIAGHGAAAHAA